MEELTPQEYRSLLRGALPTSYDSNTISPDPRSLFTPQAHRRALDPDVTVVKGGRGVGKTVWFQALQDDELREIAAEEYRLPQLRRVRAFPGFGADQSESYPRQRTLEDLLQRANAKIIWETVVLKALGHPELQSGKWSERVEWIRDHAEDTDEWLIRADQDADSTGTTKLFLFDALEWLHSNRDHADQLTIGMLQLALDLRITTRNLRAKVFIRHDWLDKLQLNFSDASKILSNQADLQWPRSNLYGLLFHYLGNADDEHSATFRNMTGAWTSSSSRFLPPEPLLGDPDRQHTAFVSIAGPYMGPDRRRGHTYTWVPNHLADGAGQVSPRSFLNALRTATENSEDQHPSHAFALHWEPIKQGVQSASSMRLKEITDDINWVPTTIDPLRGRQVPIEQSEVEACWQRAEVQSDLAALQQKSPDDESPAGPRDLRPGKLIDELIELGIMTRRKDGRLDLPDIYRIAFGLGRKGGVPRVRQS
ncbi:hypothetical protein ABT324_21815 [Saccharopolyspora sp. NPDC000359]|uniref:hypothetical protein n=1 Tax=Saccharopolyspora sp. NPDC000359 TaxID=3154251 RepID=UPI0033342C77